MGKRAFLQSCGPAALCAAGTGGKVAISYVGLPCKTREDVGRTIHRLRDFADGRSRQYPHGPGFPALGASENLPDHSRSYSMLRGDGATGQAEEYRRSPCRAGLPAAVRNPSHLIRRNGRLRLHATCRVLPCRPSVHISSPESFLHPERNRAVQLLCDLTPTGTPARLRASSGTDAVHQTPETSFFLQPFHFLLRSGIDEHVILKISRRTGRRMSRQPAPRRRRTRRTS